jgi:hypothetical protein
MNRRTALLAAALAAAATTFATTATAQAACSTSSGSSAVFTDAFDSPYGLAPEIGTVSAGVDGQCNYVVDPGIGAPLIDGDAAFVYIDTDGNAATGDPVIGGADVAIGTVGTYAGQSPPFRGVWNGTTFAFSDPGPVGVSVGNGGFSAKLDALPIAPGVVTQLIVGALYIGDYDIYADFAPDPGLGRIALPVNYSTAAAPPAASPMPAPAPRKVPVRQTKDDDACVVPRTRGLTVGGARTRLHREGCEVAQAPKRAYSTSVRRGRVVGTTVPAGRNASSAVRLVVSKGKRPRHAKAATSGSLLTRLNALVVADRAAVR